MRGPVTFPALLLYTLSHKSTRGRERESRVISVHAKSFGDSRGAHFEWRERWLPSFPLIPSTILPPLSSPWQSQDQAHAGLPSGADGISRAGEQRPRRARQAGSFHPERTGDHACLTLLWQRPGHLGLWILNSQRPQPVPCGPMHTLYSDDSCRGRVGRSQGHCGPGHQSILYTGREVTAGPHPKAGDVAWSGLV